MKVIIQRCERASLVIDNEIYSSIKHGVVALVGFTHGDTIKDVDYIVEKLVNLRIFDDENGIMNKSVIDVSGEVLSVSQFTLYGNTKKGRRPSYKESMNPKEAMDLYDIFNEKLNEKIPTKTGVFQAKMKVNLINDGPVTLIVESR